MRQPPLIIGHRGASAVAPENTLAAFRKAIDAGADGIEFDVRLSSDGIPVIIHDETLRRTALRSERVVDLTAEELQNTDAGSWFAIARRLSTNEYGDEKIPTLEQLLDDFSSNNALLYLEIKCAPFELPRIVDATAHLIETHSVADRTIVECFDLAVIEAIKRRAPSLKTAALFEPSIANPGALISGQKLVALTLAAGADEIALHHRLANKRAVEAARKAGLRVVVWTVDDPGWIKRSNEVGIDCLITNDPARMVAHRDDL